MYIHTIKTHIKTMKPPHFPILLGPHASQVRPARGAGAGPRLAGKPRAREQLGGAAGRHRGR